MVSVKETGEKCFRLQKNWMDSLDFFLPLNNIPNAEDANANDT